MKRVHDFLIRLVRAVLRRPDLPGIAVSARVKGRVYWDPSRHLYLRFERVADRSFTTLQIDSFGAQGCTFERCDFSGMHLENFEFAGGWEQTRYIECKFDGTRFGHVGLGQARFERCSFREVRIRNVLAHAAEFVDCVFSGVLDGAAIYGRVCGDWRERLTRDVNEIRGNDFSEMRIVDIDFREGVDLSLQRLPVGDNYLRLRQPARSLAAIQQKYLQTLPSRSESRVMDLLTVLQENVSAGQSELFLCKGFRPLLSKQEGDELWAELRRYDSQIG
jgi:hypothetical protein